MGPVHIALRRVPEDRDRLKGPGSRRHSAVLLDGTPIQFSKTERAAVRALGCVTPEGGAARSRRAEEANRSFSSCNLFLRRGVRFSAQPCGEGSASGATCVGRRAGLLSSRSAAAAAARRRDADTSARRRRVKNFELLLLRSEGPLGTAEGANYHGRECCQP